MNKMTPTAIRTVYGFIIFAFPALKSLIILAHAKPADPASNIHTGNVKNSRNCTIDGSVVINADKRMRTMLNSEIDETILAQKFLVYESICGNS